jgi:DNA-binding NtrC family response regulator
MARILIVDDEDGLRHSIELELTRVGHDCQAAATAGECRQMIARTTPDLAIVDIRLPDADGLDLIRQIKADGFEMPIVVLTAFASVPNAVAAMKEGVADYIEKPVDLDQLGFVVNRCLEHARVQGRLEVLERSTLADTEDTQLIGESLPFIQAIDLARRAADPGVNSPKQMPTVLLLGETGTGKDVFARYIHRNGPLAGESFVHVNCTALPADLIESELFGHEKGAFTDAKSTKRGLLELAARGTVFLDEIGDMPNSLQSKLLGALEHKAFRRVGGTHDRHMNARVIAATNADLDALVEQGRFRSDLYFRLKVFTIELPALHTRGEDVLLLAEHFAGMYGRKYRKPGLKFALSTREALLKYTWPGNVRELSHLLERAILLCEGPDILPEHVVLPQHEPRSEHLSTPAHAPDPIPGQQADLKEIERAAILQALDRSNHNVSKAARLLGLSRGGLRRRMERLGIAVRRESAGPDRPRGPI